MTRRVRQRNERFAKPLEEPLGGMPLLARSLTILRQPIVDDPANPIQFGPPDRWQPPIAGWDRKRQNLPNAVTRSSEMPGRFTLAHAFSARQANLAIQGATLHLLDRIRLNFSYSSHLLIGLVDTALLPNLGPPEDGFSRLSHDDGLVTPSG